MTRRVVFWVAIALQALAAASALGSVKPVSPDGEATVYLAGDFSGDFEIAYRARLAPAPHNKSWSTLSVLLVGRVIPGPGASVGIANGVPSGGVLSTFSDVTFADGKNSYRNGHTACSAGCVLELHGTKQDVRALIDGKQVAFWPRSALSLVGPSIQLNAEVHAAGDVITASLVRLHAVAGGLALADPTCAFTTRGIEANGRRTLRFTGTNHAAPGTYFSPITGARSDSC